MAFKKFRASYKRLCEKVDEWNKNHGLKPGDYGYMHVRNDGNVHWLTYEVPGRGQADYPLADGTVGGCYRLVDYITPATLRV